MVIGHTVKADKIGRAAPNGKTRPWVGRTSCRGQERPLPFDLQCHPQRVTRVKSPHGRVERSFPMYEDMDMVTLMGQLVNRRTKADKYRLFDMERGFIGSTNELGVAWTVNRRVDDSWIVDRDKIGTT